MKYIEKYLTVKYFEELNSDYKEELSKVNNTTTVGLKKRLEKEVYEITFLSPREKKWLLDRICDMEEDEISILERVNHLPLRYIFDLLRKEQV